MESSGPVHPPPDPPDALLSVDVYDSVPEKEEALARAVAKVLVFGFRGTSVNSHARSLLARGAGGVILYHKNMKDVDQVANLCAELKRIAGQELLIMVDQEGGLVTRFGPPFTRIPPASVIGRTGDMQAAAAVGSILGKELRAVGIDINLAPVVDVATNRHNPVIGSRAFGSIPALVGDMGYAFIRALQREGVGACAKHFPGHGDTSTDSHLELPVLGHDLRRLQEVELPPFTRAVEADVAAVMIAHLVVPAMDGRPEGQQQQRPASMSRKVVDHLREELQFEGLVLSDCMEMGAIVKNFSVGEAAVEAVAAGVDMVLVSRKQEVQVSAIDALARAVRQGRLPYSRIMEARQRIAAVTKMFATHAVAENTSLETEFHKFQLRVIGCKEHQDMVANIEFQAASAVTEHSTPLD